MLSDDCHEASRCCVGRPPGVGTSSDSSPLEASWSFQDLRRKQQKIGTMIIWLVVWNMFYFPINIRNNHPNWRTHIFQRGGPTTTQKSMLVGSSHIQFQVRSSFRWFSSDWFCGACFNHVQPSRLEAANAYGYLALAAGGDPWGFPYRYPKRHHPF